MADAPTPAKYDDVLLPFLALMRKELHANSSKGDRPGWLNMSPKTCLLEIYWHTAKLSAAVKNNDNAAILEHAADVANMAMMQADLAVLLTTLPADRATTPSPPVAAPPATPDTTTLEAAMRAIEQALSLIGEPQDERMRTVRRVLRGAVVIAEDAAAQPQPQPAQPLTGTKLLIGVIANKHGDPEIFAERELLIDGDLQRFPIGTRVYVDRSALTRTAPSTPTPPTGEQS